MNAPEAWRLRVRDLCAATGVSRQVVHFYVREGLLPPGRKTGRNQAVYGPEHIDRIQLVRRLQHERFLPLKAIKALLAERDDSLTAPQRAFLAGMRAELVDGDGRGTVALQDVLGQGFTQEEDVRELLEAGLLPHEVVDGQVRLPREELLILELMGALRAAGLTRELGFRASDLGVYKEAVGALVKAELRLVVDRLAPLGPAEAGARIRNALPFIHQLIAHIHQVHIQDLLATV